MSVLARKKPIPAIVPADETVAPAMGTDTGVNEQYRDADVDAAITNDEIEQHMEVAQVAEVGPFESDDDDGPVENTEADANRSAQLEMPIATIDLDKQGDFPLELGTVEASANYPDGSRVVVTVEGGKFRREEPGEPYFSALIRGE